MMDDFRQPAPSLGLAVPLYDEAPLVERVTADLVNALDATGAHWRLALVDNGSLDGTGSLVDRLASADERVLAVHLPRNAGYGGGILAGIAALREAIDPDVLGWAWGDGQVDPRVIGPLYRACAEGAPLAKACRTHRRDGWQRLLLSSAYARVMSAMGVTTPDVNGCPKLLRREAYLTLAPTCRDWFLDAEVVLGAERRGWRVAWHPVTMAPRPAGRSKVRATTVAEFARHLVRWRLSGRP